MSENTNKKNLSLDMEDTIIKLAGIYCTNHEIAIICGIEEDTLVLNYLALIERGRVNCRASLRRRQWQSAMEGNPRLLIWLGKQILGQTDRQIIETRDNKLTFDQYVTTYRAKHPKDLMLEDAEIQ